MQHVFVGFELMVAKPAAAQALDQGHQHPGQHRRGQGQEDQGQPLPGDQPEKRAAQHGGHVLARRGDPPLRDQFSVDRGDGGHRVAAEQPRTVGLAGHGDLPGRGARDDQRRLLRGLGQIRGGHIQDLKHRMEAPGHVRPPLVAGHGVQGLQVQGGAGLRLQVRTKRRRLGHGLHEGLQGPARGRELLGRSGHLRRGFRG